MPVEVMVRIEGGPGRFSDQKIDVTVRSVRMDAVEEVAIMAARKALAALNEQGEQA